MREALDVSHESKNVLFTQDMNDTLSLVLRYEPENELIVEYQKAILEYLRQGLNFCACSLKYNRKVLESEEKGDDDDENGDSSSDSESNNDEETSEEEINSSSSDGEDGAIDPRRSDHQTRK
jgi:hypothetical protein